MVIKTVDATEEQLADLREEIIQMSKEIPSTADEIAKVASIAGQLGIAADDIVEFTRVMIDLGVAADDVTADEAALSLAKFANITKMGTDDYSRLGSVITELGKNYCPAY